MSHPWGRRVRLLSGLGLLVLAFVVLAASTEQAAALRGQSAASELKHKKSCAKKHKKPHHCKKRLAPTPAPAPGNGEIVQSPQFFTLTWDSTANLDLHVWDAAGNHTGLEHGVAVTRIPGTSYSGDDADGFGPETINDPLHEVTGYAACYRSGPGANATLSYNGYLIHVFLGPSGGDAWIGAVGYGTLPPNALDVCNG
jgi:hypothetical protein